VDDGRGDVVVSNGVEWADEEFWTGTSSLYDGDSLSLVKTGANCEFGKSWRMNVLTKSTFMSTSGLVDWNTKLFTISHFFCELIMKPNDSCYIHFRNNLSQEVRQ
jgi:hypothetical protein